MVAGQGISYPMPLGSGRRTPAAEKTTLPTPVGVDGKTTTTVNLKTRLMGSGKPSGLPAHPKVNLVSKSMAPLSTAAAVPSSAEKQTTASPPQPPTTIPTTTTTTTTTTAAAATTTQQPLKHTLSRKRAIENLISPAPPNNPKSTTSSPRHRPRPSPPLIPQSTTADTNTVPPAPPLKRSASHKETTNTSMQADSAPPPLPKRSASLSNKVSTTTVKEPSSIPIPAPSPKHASAQSKPSKKSSSSLASTSWYVDIKTSSSKSTPPPSKRKSAPSLASSAKSSKTTTTAATTTVTPRPTPVKSKSAPKVPMIHRVPKMASRGLSKPVSPPPLPPLPPALLLEKEQQRRTKSRPRSLSDPSGSDSNRLSIIPSVGSCAEGEGELLNTSFPTTPPTSPPTSPAIQIFGPQSTTLSLSSTFPSILKISDTLHTQIYTTSKEGSLLLAEHFTRSALEVIRGLSDSLPGYVRGNEEFEVVRGGAVFMCRIFGEEVRRYASANAEVGGEGKEMNVREFGGETLGMLRVAVKHLERFVKKADELVSLGDPNEAVSGVQLDVDSARDVAYSNKEVMPSSLVSAVSPAVESSQDYKAEEPSAVSKRKTLVDFINLPPPPKSQEELLLELLVSVMSVKANPTAMAEVKKAALEVDSVDARCLILKSMVVRCVEACVRERERKVEKEKERAEKEREKEMREKEKLVEDKAALHQHIAVEAREENLPVVSNDASDPSPLKQAKVEQAKVGKEAKTKKSKISLKQALKRDKPLPPVRNEVSDPRSDISTENIQITPGRRKIKLPRLSKPISLVTSFSSSSISLLSKKSQKPSMTVLESPPKVPSFRKYTVRDSQLIHTDPYDATKKVRMPVPTGDAWDMEVDENGVTRIATLDALVRCVANANANSNASAAVRERCSSSSSLTAEDEEDLLQIFFRFFRLFSTPLEVFEAMEARFAEEPPELLNLSQLEIWAREATRTRVRVALALKRWVEVFWKRENDVVVVVPMLEFVFTHVKDGTLSVTAASTILDLLCRIEYETLQGSSKAVEEEDPHSRIEETTNNLLISLKEEECPTKYTIPLASPRVNPKGFAESFRYQAFDGPEELARQLTIMASRCFMSIDPEEAVHHWREVGCSPSSKKTLGGESDGGVSEKITVVVRLEESVNLWVQNEILEVKDMKRRGIEVLFWLRVAEWCLMQRNFCISYAIFSAVGSSAINRLKDTIISISPRNREVYWKLRRFFTSSYNHQAYRISLEESCAPAVPLLSVLAHDICAVAEITSIHSNSNKRINLGAYRTMWKTMKSMERGRIPYHYRELPAAQQWISLELAKYDPGKHAEISQALYERSLKLEAKNPEILDGDQWKKGTQQEHLERLEDWRYATLVHNGYVDRKVKPALAETGFIINQEVLKEIHYLKNPPVLVYEDSDDDEQDRVL